MTEALIGRLSMIRGLRVISRTSVMSLKDSKLSARDIAKTLQVDALVEGSVIREGIRIRVYAQLIRGATDEHFWSETYDRELPTCSLSRATSPGPLPEKSSHSYRRGVLAPRGCAARLA